MRLFDKLLAERGRHLDIAMQGSITNLVPYLKEAQCFQMSGNIAMACWEVCQSRPSSVLSALHMIRTPYPNIWIEWIPDDRVSDRPNNKPVPAKCGMLLVTDNHKEGWGALAWEHKDGSLMLCPLGLSFVWEKGESAVEHYANQFNTAQLGIDPKWASDRKRAWVNKELELPDRWQRWQGDPVEHKAAIELEMTALVIPLEPCMLHLQTFNVLPGTHFYNTYVDDLAGELPFVESFLLLLNSRNSIIEQTRDDFSRLNNARRKNKKPPLKEFVNTRIKLSKIQSNRAIAAGVPREAARLHRVRGHFKVRSSGVYWWNSHQRGKGDDVLTRKEYEVT